MKKKSVQIKKRKTVFILFSSCLWFAPLKFINFGCFGKNSDLSSKISKVCWVWRLLRGANRSVGYHCTLSAKRVADDQNSSNGRLQTETDAPARSTSNPNINRALTLQNLALHESIIEFVQRGRWVEMWESAGTGKIAKLKQCPIFSIDNSKWQQIYQNIEIIGGK